MVGFLKISRAPFAIMTILFAKEPNKKRRYSAKNTCNFQEPTNRSHSIGFLKFSRGPFAITRILFAGLF